VKANKCLDTERCNMITTLAAAEIAIANSSSPIYDEIAIGSVMA
jgi:hypothetical protein